MFYPLNYECKLRILRKLVNDMAFSKTLPKTLPIFYSVVKNARYLAFFGLKALFLPISAGYISPLGGGRSILPSYGNNTFVTFSSIMIIAAFCEKIKSIIDDLLYCLAALRRLFRLIVFRTENFVIWTNRLSLKAKRNRRERFRPSRAFPFLRCFSYRKKAPFPIWETAACIRKSCPKSYRKT